MKNFDDFLGVYESTLQSALADDAVDFADSLKHVDIKDENDVVDAFGFDFDAQNDVRVIAFEIATNILNKYSNEECLAVANAYYIQDVVSACEDNGTVCTVDNSGKIVGDNGHDIVYDILTEIEFDNSTGYDADLQSIAFYIFEKLVCANLGF